MGRTKLGGGFKYSLFSSLVGEDSHFDFQVGWFNYQPVRIGENVFTALFTLDPWRVGLNGSGGAACGFPAGSWA